MPPPPHASQLRLEQDSDPECQAIKKALTSGGEEVFNDSSSKKEHAGLRFSGKDTQFFRLKDGIVYLHMQGACSGCPSSTATLKMGIENMLKHYVPEVQEVRPIDA